MKRFIDILLSVAVLPMLVSCGKDFLERYPKGTWIAENITDKEVQEIPYAVLIEGELANAYANQHSYDFSAAAPVLHCITTDDAVKGSTEPDFGVAIPFEAHTWDASAGIVNQYYSTWYNVITYSNRAIQYADGASQYDSTISEADANYFKAQAITLRAHAYFRLIQAFGDVPYVDRELGQDEKTPARTPKDEIYAQLVTQLEWAIPNLKTRAAMVAAGDLGRVSQNSARAILAKIYMYQKDWANSRVWTDAIISSGDNDLSTPFDQIWTEAQEFGPESVYEMDLDYKPSLSIESTGNRQWANIQGFRGQPNAGWGINGPSPVLRADMAGDPRYEATVLSDGDVREGVTFQSASVPNPYYNAKCYAPLAEQNAYNRNSANAQWMNIRVIRYSDIVLMHAESACELGDLADARQKLEMVRARARGGKAGVLPEITTDNQAELREAIHSERRFELAMEFERYFDLVRWDETDKISGFVKGTQELFPIPQRQIDASNGILTQNPGY
ncbi:MAG: RagB/SusD family nutrient uptake outer membrane protein [Bacteroidales bacterium]|nr:RagB/SusD family nutrient uptake outer membrane protein [Bacteroidales bacterium]